MTGEILEPSTRLVVTLESPSRLSPREGDFRLNSDARAQSNSMIVPSEYRVSAELRGNPPFSMAHAIASPKTIDVTADEVTTIDIELRPTGSVPSDDRQRRSEFGCRDSRNRSRHEIRFLIGRMEASRLRTEGRTWPMEGRPAPVRLDADGIRADPPGTTAVPPRSGGLDEQ